MLKRILKMINRQLGWWRSQIAFGAQRRQQEARATSIAVAMCCTGVLRRQR